MFSDRITMVPRNPGGPLRVLCIGHGPTTSQDIGVIAVDPEYAKAIIQGIYGGQAHIKCIGEQGSGLVAERITMIDAYKDLETRTWDLVLMHGGLASYRDPRWVLAFIQDAIQCGTRVIAPGDHLDTSDANWEKTLRAAALRQGVKIPDIRRPVRATSAKSFHEGGMVGRIRTGYRKITKEEAASGQYGPKGLRIAKIAECTAIILALKDKVVHDRMYGAQLVDWLNHHGKDLPPGPYADTQKWTWDLLRNYLRDPILCGRRRFRQVVNEPMLPTGQQHRSRNLNPEFEYHPTLAHISELEWQELQQAMDQLASPAASPAGPHNPRYRVPAHHSLVPLQHATCGACGGFLYLSGHDVVKCQNALTHTPDGCWNHVQVSSLLVRQKLVNILLDSVHARPEAEKSLLDLARKCFDQPHSVPDLAAKHLEDEVKNLESQAEHLAKAIALGGNLESLIQQLKTVEGSLKMAKGALQQHLNDHASIPVPTAAWEQLKVDPPAALLNLANTSFEFADLLRRIFPRFVIQPVQALDSGLVRPRAILTLDLSVLPGVGESTVDRPQREELAIDLFEPPAHIRALATIIPLKKDKAQRGQWASLGTLAQETGIHRMTIKRALGYQKLMDTAGLAEPYRVLSAAPAQASRWKARPRHDQLPAEASASTP